MDLAAWGLDKLDWTFLLGILNIVIIDLILAGDNAVVIAMAVRSLPRRQRKWGIILGRAPPCCCGWCSPSSWPNYWKYPLLNWPAGCSSPGSRSSYFWRARPNRRTGGPVPVAGDAAHRHRRHHHEHRQRPSRGRGFPRQPLSPDLRLALSIPFVVLTSNLLAMLMDRYPVIIYLGAAVLGRVAGEMIFTDPWVMRWLQMPAWFNYTMEAVFAIGVIVVGKLWIKFVFRKDEET